MVSSLEKNFADMNDGIENDQSILNKADSQIRRLQPFLNENGSARIHHILLNEVSYVFLDDEAYFAYIREGVRRALRNELLGSRLELEKLQEKAISLEAGIEGSRIQKRKGLLRARIEILDPLVAELEVSEDRDTIPTDPADKELSENTLTVESASEFLISGALRGAVKGNRIVCSGILSLTPDGAEKIASWYGVLNFPDMEASDFNGYIRKIFMEGHVEAVFAGDNPVITKEEKKLFQKNEDS